jgi:pyridoxine 4-dehydrogenase
LAWLLRRSPNILLVPGTTSITHLEQNVSAAEISLTDAEWARVEQVCEQITPWRPTPADQ